MRKLIMILSSLMFVGCATHSGKPIGRRIIDSAYEAGNRPAWVSDSRVTWQDEDDVYKRTAITLRGDQRIDSCFTLANAELRESFLLEINSMLKSELNIATEGTSEGDPQTVSKMILQITSGSANNIRVRESTYERYKVGESERIECFVLGSISKENYAKLRQNVFQKAISPKIQAAIEKRGENFFRTNQSDLEDKGNIESSRELEKEGERGGLDGEG